MTIAFVLINTRFNEEVKDLESVISELQAMTEVQEVKMVSGAYDLLLKLEVDSIHKIREIVITNIRNQPYIETTMTLIVM